MQDTQYDYILDSKATGFKYHMMNSQNFWKGILEHQVYQIRNIQFTHKLLKDKKDIIILDLGANIGQTSLEYSKFAKRVIGFEMIREICQQANDNFKLNNLTESQCHAYNYALGNKKSVIPYKRINGNDGMSHVLSEDTVSTHTSQMIRLDSFELLNELPSIDFIKIDVEGFELPVLKGAVKAIAKYKPIIQIECNGGVSIDRYNYTADELFEFLRSLGYKGITRMGDEVLNHAQVKRKHNDTFWLPR